MKMGSFWTLLVSLLVAKSTLSQGFSGFHQRNQRPTDVLNIYICVFFIFTILYISLLVLLVLLVLGSKCRYSCILQTNNVTNKGDSLLVGLLVELRATVRRREHYKPSKNQL